MNSMHNNTNINHNNITLTSPSSSSNQKRGKFYNIHPQSSKNSSQNYNSKSFRSHKNLFKTHHINSTLKTDNSHDNIQHYGNTSDYIQSMNINNSKSSSMNHTKYTPQQQYQQYQGIEQAKIFLENWITQEQQIVILQSENQQQQMEQVFSSLKSILNYIELQQELTRLREKDFQNMKLMNNFFQQSIKKKDEMYVQISKENIALKSTLQAQEIKIKKLQNQNLVMNKTLQFEDVSYKLNSPKKSNTNINNKQQQNQQQPSQQEDLAPSSSNKKSARHSQDRINVIVKQDSQTSNNVPPSPKKRKKSTTNNQLNTNLNNQSQQNANNNLNSANNTQDSSVNNSTHNLLSANTTNSNLNPHHQSKHGFMQHNTEFASLLTLLDMNISDDTITQQNQDNKQIQLFNELSNDEQFLKTYVQKLNKHNFQQLYESLHHASQTTNFYFQLILKLKKVINSCTIMQQSLVLQDAFNTIVEQTCTILNCDRASVFLVDNKKQILWTKVQTGTDKIIVPIGQGFVGHVASTGQVLNIFDAQHDHRFNKSYDIKNKYTTKTILSVPILDKSKVIGVLQAVNKESGYFLKDDEGLIIILAKLAQVVLRNSIYHDDKLAFHNSLRSLLQVGIMLNGQRSIADLIKLAEKKLISNFGVTMARIYLYNKKQDNLYYFNEDKEKIESPSQQGTSFCADIFSNGNMVFQSNNYNNTSFNSKIDLDTQLPVLGLPLYASEDKKKIKLGVIQAVNSNGIQELTTKGENNHNPKIFYDILENFSLVLGQTVYNLVNPQNEEISHFLDIL